MFEKLQKFFNNAKTVKPNGKFIVVVEDNNVDRELVVRILQKEGYEVRTAVNGKEALSIIKETQPDLIILDCNIPEVEGLEVCRRLKEEDLTSKIPVIFLTGDDTPKNVFECYEMDAENFLKKPVPAKTLISEVELILKTESSSR